jgi:hypothetical protein
MCWFMVRAESFQKFEARCQPAARSCLRSGDIVAARSIEAADRDLEAGDALVAGHRRRAAAAHRLDETRTSSARSGSSWPTDRWRIE